MLIGKNILFLYPSFQQKLFAQQSIVIIKQFIDEIKIAQKGAETNFFILTTNDLAKIVFDNDVTILQDKITKNSILSVIKRYKIDTLIHLVGNENYDKILNNESFLNKKGLNVFYKEFYIYNKKS